MTNGTYEFLDLPAKNYFLKAAPSENSIYFNSHIPTYSKDSIFWQNTPSLGFCGLETYEANINLQEIVDEMGMGRIAGNIDIANAEGRVSKILEEGKPVNLIVLNSD